MLLARMLPIMPELRARLSLTRVSQTRVHIAGSCTAEGGRSGRLGGFFAVVTLDGRVICLAGHFGCGVRFEGAVGGGGAGREGFGVEFGGGVVAN